MPGLIDKSRPYLISKIKGLQRDNFRLRKRFKKIIMIAKGGKDA